MSQHLHIKTERLRLRPYQEPDFDVFAKLHGDPTLKANTHAKALNRPQARDLFDGYLAAWKNTGFGMYSVRLGESDAFVGECGLWYREDAGGYTLRYILSKAHWNQGYNFEAVKAVLSDAFDHRGLDAVYAIAMAHNFRSTRILQRAGMVQVDEAFRGVPNFLRFQLLREHFGSSPGRLT